MKKLLVLLLALALIFTFAACGQQEGTVEEVPEEEGAPEVEVLGEPITVSIGNVCGETETINVACYAFQEWMATEHPEANITIEIYPNAVLGGDEAMLESVALGTLGMDIPSTASMTVYSEQFSALALPYLFSSFDEAFAAADGEVGEFLDKQLEGTGMISVGYNVNGARNMTNNVRPITSVADMKGIKFRVLSSPIYVDMFTAWGANPTPMSYNEIYTGLQQGTVEGQDNAVCLDVASKFYEVQKYLSITEHVFDLAINIMNEDLYNSMTDAQRAVFDEGVRTYLVDYQRQLALDEEAGAIATMEENGVEVNYLSDEAKAEFRAAVDDLYTQYHEQLGDEVFDLIAKYTE